MHSGHTAVHFYADGLSQYDHSRQDFISFPESTGHAFACQGGGVERRFGFLQNSVERYASARLYLDPFTCLHLFRGDVDIFTFTEYIRTFGTDIEQAADIL